MAATSLGDIRALEQSWRVSLEASNKSGNSDAIYSSALELFAKFLLDRGMPIAASAITGEHVESFLVWMQQEGYKPASVRNRYTGIQQFLNWAQEEGEITVSPMPNMSAPTIPETPPPLLSDAQVKALLSTCKGTSFADRRDRAIILAFHDAGLRLSELARLTYSRDPNTSDVDLATRTLTVLGKGSRPRTVGLGAKATQALSRYIRARRHADLAALWLGPKGAMTGSRIGQVIERRGEEAGIPGLYPHYVEASVRPPVAEGRGRGRRPDAPRRLEVACDAEPLRGEYGNVVRELREGGRPALTGLRDTGGCGAVGRCYPVSLVASARSKSREERQWQKGHCASWDLNVRNRRSRRAWRVGPGGCRSEPAVLPAAADTSACRRGSSRSASGTATPGRTRGGTGW